MGGRIRYGNAQRSPHTEPILIHIEGPGAEGAGTAADQPAKNDAAANMLQTPAPVLHGAELLAALLRNQSKGYVVSEELAEQCLRFGKFIGACGRMAQRFLLKFLRILRQAQLSFEDGLIGRQKSLQHRLEVGIVDFWGSRFIGCLRRLLFVFFGHRDAPPVLTKIVSASIEAFLAPCNKVTPRSLTRRARGIRSDRWPHRHSIHPKN